MYRKMLATLALTALMLTAAAPSAFASTASFDPPVEGAQLVSRDTVSGADAVTTMMNSVESVDLNPGAAVITVDDANGPHEITLDYGDLMDDKRTASVGYVAGAYVGLGALSRLARLVRGILGPLGR